MPTVIGAIFFCCAAYFFLFKEDGLFGLLIIASTFQAASAVNIAERGIQPYYLVAVFIIARAVWNQTDPSRSRRRIPPWGVWLLCFGLIAVFLAFVLPFYFAGIPVDSPKPEEGPSTPLKFGFNNVAQAAFLACHIAAAFGLFAIKFAPEKVRKAYIYAFYFVVFIVAAQSVCQLTGIPFPYSLFLNNPGYFLWEPDWSTGGTRNPGTFSEPSFAGLFLLMYYASFLSEYLEGRAGLKNLLIALIASALVTSGGSLFALCLVTLVLSIRYFPFRFPWYINVSRTKRLLSLALLTGTPLVLAIIGFSSYRESLMTNTVSKGESGSFLNRIAADLHAVQVVIQTHGIGVGLGSNRASSLLLSLLSNVGILGVLVFAGFVVKLVAGLPREYAWLGWALFAVVLNMCIAVPDVTTPTLWISLMLAMQFSSSNPGVAGSAKRERALVTA